jgi:phage regulator Rha-like protein
MTPKLKPEYTSEWIYTWFERLCKRLGFMLIASNYSGNDLKIKAYIDEIKQLKKELAKRNDEDSRIMLTKLDFIHTAAMKLQ